MRYRQLDAGGDMTFGASQNNFFVNTPMAVAQAVMTRLLLIEGEWWQDLTTGTPWMTEILGSGTTATLDLAIRERILDTQGVVDIAAYSSIIDPNTRHVQIAAVIDTQYGQANITAVL